MAAKSRIAYVSKGAQVASSAGTADVTLPKGIELGDLLLMQVAGRPIGTAGTNDTISVNNSWTLAPSSSVRFEAGTSDLRTEIWYKIANATEVGASPSNPTITAGTNWQGTTAGYTGQIICFSGVDTATPFDATAVTSTNAAAATRQPTGITTATANAVVLSFASTADDNALNFNTANGYAILYSGANYDTTTGADHAVACAMAEYTTTGAKTCPTWNESVVGNDGWACVTVALKPTTTGTDWDHQETWCKTNGSTWGPVDSWSTAIGTDGTVNTQGARGRVACGTGASYTASSFGYLTTGSESADYGELRFRWEVSTTAEHYMVFYWRDSGGSSGDYYRMQISYGAGAQIDAWSAIAFTETAVVTANTTALGALAVGDVVHVYLSHVGSTLKIGAWKNNAAESQTNVFNSTNSAVSAAGQTTIGILGGAASANQTLDYAAFRFVHSASVNGTATPAAIAGAATLPAPTLIRTGTATPAAIAGVTALPAPTIIRTGTATPAAIAGAATLPAPTLIRTGTATPAAIAGVTTLPAPTVTATATTTPAVIAAVAALPAPTLTAGSSATATPAVITTAATLPAPTLTNTGTATPAALTALATLPAPTVTATATTTPAAIAAVAALPAPTLIRTGTATPAAIAGVTALPAPTLTAGSSATATPTAIAAAATLPAPSFVASSSATPTATAALVTLPAPTLTATATATPAAIAGVTTLPAPTVTATATTTPAVIAAVAALPAPTLTTTGTATPTALAAVAALPAPTLNTGSVFTATPSVLPALAALPAPTLTATATVSGAPVAATAALPAPTVIRSATATPALLGPLSVALPAPTFTATATAAVITVAGVAAINTPTIALAQLAQPAAVASVVAMPAPTILGGIFPDPWAIHYTRRETAGRVQLLERGRLTYRATAGRVVYVEPRRRITYRERARVRWNEET